MARHRHRYRSPLLGIALTGALLTAALTGNASHPGMNAATGPHGASVPRMKLTAASTGVTAAAFGPIYNYNDVTSGNASQGDTFYNTWTSNDQVDMVHDDGTGFAPGGTFYNDQLTTLSGDPNSAPTSIQGTNLNPGSLGTTLPQTYSAGLADVDGTLYKFAHYSCQSSCGFDTTTFFNTSLIKSTDGGANWYNAQGQENTAPPDDLSQSTFTDNIWGFPAFINYGPGDSAPNVDDAQDYVYMVSPDASGTSGDNPVDAIFAPNVYLARVARDLIGNLNADHTDFQYWDGSGWSTDINSSSPILSDPEDTGNVQVNYDYALKQYVMSSNSAFFANDNANNESYRLGVYTAPHPWGPWTKLLSYAEPHRLGGMLANNFYTTPDGKKMWWLSTGDYNGDYYPYGLLEHAVYLSTGTVDAYPAASATLLGGASIGSGYDSQYPNYVTNMSNYGDGVRFTVNNIDGTGWHIVRFRYSSTNSSGNQVSVYVNGSRVQSLPLPLNDTSYKSSEDWADNAGIYYLQNGTNTIDVKVDYGDSGSGLNLEGAYVSEEPTYDEGRNVAPTATPTTSSNASGYSAQGLIGGLPAPGSTVYQWLSGSTTPTSWAQLTWNNPVTLNKVVLFNSPGNGAQITSGTLTFSDGSTLPVGKLQTDGQAGTVVTFPGKTVTSVRFTMTGGNGGGDYGLGQFQAFSPGTTYDDDDTTNAVYSGNWSSGPQPGYYGSGAHWSDNPGDSVTYSFVGPDVAWIGGRAVTHGKADVSIDGQFQQTVDTYAAQQTNPSVLYVKTGLADALHTLTITVDSATNPAATGDYTDIDAFCTRCAGITDDSGPGVSYSSSGWSSGSQPGFYDGTAHWSNTAGATATFSFYGSNVSWIGGEAATHGLADVYIDGTLDRTVDTYASSSQQPSAVYTKTGLPVGQHTIKIVVRSDHDSAATNNYTDIDAFEYSS